MSSSAPETDAFHNEKNDFAGADAAASPKLLVNFIRHLALAVTGVSTVVAATVYMAESSRQASRDAGFAAVADPGSGDLAIGRQLFATSCASCHGGSGEGMPQQGVPLRGSAFIARASEHAMVNFIRAGRPADDRNSITGRSMPPKGGNVQLSDQDLTDIARYLRSIRSVASAQ